MTASIRKTQGTLETLNFIFGRREPRPDEYTRDAFEAGQHTRNLRLWSANLLREAETNTKVISISKAAREAEAVTTFEDMKAALKARRECALILRRMRRVPGFIEGYRA